jgi:serine/threonine-protein kinase
MPGVQETLAGRYELLEILGRGGMGVVYRARDRVLDRIVAVKVLPADRSQDPMFVTRFEREARSVAALNHPNIVAVFDTGHDDSTRFIVMEFVSGMSLQQGLRQQGPLSAARAVDIAARIASALAAAHEKGIIHRDIKPGNVMVDDAGTLKVLDFGIARTAASTSLTQTAVVLGSAPYLAPEVARGEPADERSDVYSLGCVLYELLTGRPPFTGELPAAIMHQHNTSQPRAPRDLNPDIPVALDALIMRMLAKRPTDRPQRAGQLAEELPASMQASPAPAEPGTTGPTAVAGVTAPTRVLPRARRVGRREAIALAAALALVVLVVLLLAPGSQPHRTSQAGTTPKTATHQARKLSATTTTRPAAAATTTTVPAAAAELTRLATQDLQSGTIDQQASQPILSHLQDILNSYSMGHTADALHKIGDLTQQIAQLSDHGDIHASALPAIDTAVSNLSSALARAAPVTSTSAPAPADTGPAAPGPNAPKHAKPNPPKPPHH